MSKVSQATHAGSVRHWAAGFGLVLLLCGGCGIAREEPADLILVNGRVVTADAEDSVHEALAVRGSTIATVGTSSQIEAFRGQGTRVIDLEGRAVLPGLIDSHTHPVGAALTEFDHPIPDMHSIEDVLSYIRSRAAVVEPGQWIVLSQVFITRLQEKRYPTRQELDAAAPDHPVIFRTGPDASLNSAALTVLNIDGGREAPEGSLIEKNGSGRPTGILRGWSRILPSLPSASRSPTPEDRYRQLRQLFRDYNSVGITAIGDRGFNPRDRDLYERLLAEGDLKLRVALSRSIPNSGPLEDILEAVEDAAGDPLREGNSLLRLIGVKMHLDGGMLTGSAYMRRPWGLSSIYDIRDPDYRGILFVSPERLAPIVRAAIEKGLQFTAHSVGDGAVHALLDAYEEVSREVPIGHTRPCITHCNFMSREAIDQMARLGVAADIQPAWLYLDARTLTDHFGRERLRYFQPLQSCFESGLIVGGGSDHMQKIGSLRSINPYNPFLGMWVAITREARDLDDPLYPEEALTRLQAIRFYTINNAYLLFLEDQTGSLEPGKQADFAILDRDILSCEVDEIPHIQVVHTFLAGEQVFGDRPQIAP